jgi:hypothetical protein
MFFSLPHQSILSYVTILLAILILTLLVLCLYTIEYAYMYAFDGIFNMYKKQAKCCQYWPNGVGESLSVGRLTVTLTKQEQFAEYVRRSMSVCTPVSKLIINIAWCKEAAPFT